MKLKTKAIFGIAFISMLLVTVTFATLYFTRPIGNNATINAHWDIKLLRGDTLEVINTIEWGSLDPGTVISTNQLYSGLCNKIKNLGNSIVYVAWQLDAGSTLPAGVTITAEYGEPPTIAYPQNSYLVVIGPDSISTDRVEFILTTSAATPPGSFSFTINLLAADSGSG